MRNKKLTLILKYGAMLLLLIPFIAIAVTEYWSFHQPWLFLILLALIYLDAIIIIWLIFEIKRTFNLKKTALVLGLTLLSGWIIAFVTIFATKPSSLIPAEHVFGSIYALITITAIILGIYAWVSAYFYNRKKIDTSDEKTKEKQLLEQESHIEETDGAAEAVTAEAAADRPLNAKERRKLRRQEKRQEKLHNAKGKAEIKSEAPGVTNSEALTEDIPEKIQAISEKEAALDPATEKLAAHEATAEKTEKVEEIGENSTTAIKKCAEEVDKKSIQADDNTIIFNAETDSKAEPNAEATEENEAIIAHDAFDNKESDNVSYSEDKIETENIAYEAIESDGAHNVDIIEETADGESRAEKKNESECAEAAADSTLDAECLSESEFGGELADEALSDEFSRVVAAFDDEAQVYGDYRPVKINVFENDSVIPADVEVVKNEFIPSGKFVDYTIKDETRGMYEEIENENECKIALMTDLSKVIITSNVNATIVPIDCEILERTFENKLRQSDDDAKEYYSVIKNKLLSYSGVKSRVSKLADTFKCNGEVVTKITVSGKTLLVNLNLDCSRYDSKYYKFTDVGDMSKFADTPMRIKIKNKLALKRCLEIIDVMFKEKNVEASAIDEVDYASQYPTVENAVIFMNSIAHLIRRE